MIRIEKNILYEMNKSAKRQNLVQILYEYYIIY